MGLISNRVFVVEMRTDKVTFEEWINEHDKKIKEEIINNISKQINSLFSELSCENN